MTSRRSLFKRESTPTKARVETVKKSSSSGLDFSTDSLPALPHSIIKILDISEADLNSSEALANVILKDQGLTAEVLKVVNSSYYGLAERVTTIKHAVAILGFHVTKNVALGASLQKLFKTGNPEEELAAIEFWRHSIGCAVCAETVARKLGYGDPEEAFVAGLVHDIGRMLLRQRYPEKYPQVQERIREGMDILAAEKVVLGVDHSVAGLAAAEQWNMPSVLAMVIGGHHFPAAADTPQPARQLHNIIFVSNKIAAMFYEPLAGLPIDFQAIEPQADELLHLPSEQMAEIIAQLPEKVREVAEALNLRAEKPEQIIDVVSRANIELGKMNREYDRINRELDRTVQRLAVFRRLSQTLLFHNDLNQLFNKAVDLIAEVFEVETVSILYQRKGTNKLTVEAAMGLPQELVGHLEIEVGERISGWVAQDGEPLLIKNIAEDPRFEKSSFGDRYKTNSLLCLPIKSRGAVIGVLNINNKVTGRPFDENDLEFAETVANQVGVAIENAMLFDELRQKYMTEQLQTKLYQTEKMVALGQLVAGVAHEINNPVNYIKNGIVPLQEHFDAMRSFLDAVMTRSRLGETDLAELEALSQELKLDERRQAAAELFAAIRDGVERTSNIVDNLRTFARLDQNQPQPTNLHVGLDSTLTLLRPAMKGRVEVLKEYGDAPEVECLGSQINQVFMNLLNNAQQAIEEKGNITIRTWADAEMAYVSIRDTGCGIEEKALRKIFEPFFTTKDVGEGTGLGLSISHAIIEQHRGTISVKSAPGEGTEFVVALPLKFQRAQETLST